MEEKPEQSLRVWPASYENRDYISKAEKELARIFEDRVKEGHLVLQAHPSTLNGATRISFYIHDQRGLLAFLVSDSKGIPNLDAALAYKDAVEARLYLRLMDSKQLISTSDGKKLLKFPFRLIYYFGQMSLDESGLKDFDAEKALEMGMIFHESRHIQRSKNTKEIITLSNLFSNLDANYDASFRSLSENDKKAIIERLSPEYAIVLHTKESIDVPTTKEPTSNDLYPITGQEHEFKTFALDDEQVDIINDIRKGHQLILANPGAGKSVILLAKSFRIADLNPQSNVLLTCYYKNLADTYNFKKEIAGFNQKPNLHVDTFHAFILKLSRDAFLANGMNNFDKTIDKVQREIDEGIIKVRFKGIFIDEAQMFQPKWIDLCYSLLEKGEDSFFVLAGDLNQDVQNNCKRGKAVWQQAKTLPSSGFKGRVRYLRKNYRNSKEICDYLNKMLDFMVSKFSSLQVIDRAEYDYIVHGEASKAGPEPIIEKVDRGQIGRAIVDKVIWLNQVQRVPYNEIAIVFPFKEFYTNSYFILKWLKNELNRKGIPLSVIIQAEEDSCSPVRADGVVLSTIDSSLGLDFRAIILSGLCPLDYVGSGSRGVVHEKLSWSEVVRDPEMRQQYVMQMRRIYTACSRAREHLIILNDLDKNSPFNELIDVKGK